MTALGQLLRSPTKEFNILRHIKFMARWILLLVGGAFLTTLFLVPMFHHRYDDHGVGEYYGIVRGRVFGYDPTTYLEISGESSKSFRWESPDTYVYHSFDVTIFTADGRDLRGRLRVPEMMLATGAKAERMNEESFATLLLGASPSVESEKTASEIFRYLQSAGTGEFPPPRHHYYSFVDEDTRIGGNIVHWSRGKRVPHLLIYWVVIWLVVLLARVIQNLKKAGGEPADERADWKWFDD